MSTVSSHCPGVCPKGVPFVAPHTRQDCMVVQVAACQSWSSASPSVFPPNMQVLGDVQVASYHSCRHRKLGSLMMPRCLSPHITPRLVTRITMIASMIMKGRIERCFRPRRACCPKSHFGHDPVWGSSGEPHVPQKFAIVHPPHHS